jgi:4-hydroxy-tetrahydrodipicolinate synthase
MDSSKLSRPLRGIIPPLITPLLEQETLDISGFERLIERVISAGVHGLFVLGTTGEGPSLSYRVRREVIQQTCRINAGRVPILVNITDTALTEALGLACYAHDTGAQAVVYSGPFYFPLSQAELLQHVQTVASLSPLPVFLYNMPSHTGITFEVPTVKSLAQHPNIAGLKDSSGDLMYFQSAIEAVKDRRDFALLMGPEELLANALLEGAHGGVSGGANLFPSLYVKLYEAAIADSADEMMRLHRIVLEVRNRIYSAGYLKSLKCALSLQGVCSGGMAEPLRECDENERNAIAENLRFFQRFV